MHPKTLVKAFITASLLIAVIYSIINGFVSSKNSHLTDDLKTRENNTSNTPPRVDTPPSEILSNQYRIDYIVVRLPDTIELYSNLNEKLSSTEAAKKYKCASLVSGGFYTTEFRHVGLFYNNGDLASREIKHNVFDGFIISTKDNSLYISKTPPKDYENLKLALQAGPIIYYNRKPTTISSEASKERARRIVAATTQDGDIIFMVLKSKNNPLDGPTLDELPKLIDTISNQKSFNIEAAINLDGGSHSSFLTGTSNTYEVSTIGSFFCIKI